MTIPAHAQDTKSISTYRLTPPPVVEKAQVPSRYRLSVQVEDLTEDPQMKVYLEEPDLRGADSELRVGPRIRLRWKF
jgi:hypothetical protein